MAAALAAALPAFANQYFVVVPSPKHTAGVGNITVSMSGYTLPGAIQGQAYAGFDFNSVLQVMGDPSYNGTGVHFSVVGGALPAGLSLSSSGQLSGTPTSAGTSTFQVMAAYKTKAGQQTYQVVTMAITVSLASATPPQAIVGEAYSYNLNPLLTVSGDTGFSSGAVTWNVVSSSLPAGLYLTAAGYIAGTPTAGGTGTITAQASYRGVNGQQSYQVVTLNIVVALGAATPPLAMVGQAYSYDLNALLSVTGDSGYKSGAVTWNVVSSSLPAGLVLDSSGHISGTPTAAGSGAVTAQATYRGVNGRQTYQVTAQVESVSLASATLPAAKAGVSYSAYDFKPLATSNDPGFTTDAATWTVVDSLPAGMSLSSSGVLSGTPSVVGSTTFHLRASYKGASGQQAYTLTSADNSSISASTLAAFTGVSDYTNTTQSLTLTNSGTSTANLSYSSSSPNFTVSGCTSIPANTSCTATVSFYPTGVTSYSGQLSITGAANGTVTVPLSGSSVLNVQTFTTSTSWTVPAKLTSAQVLVVGGGGGPEAAGAIPNGLGGEGGGGGQVLYSASYTLTPGAVMNVVVGVGGDPGQDSTEDGTPSTFGTMTAAGGLSGFEGGASGSGKAGGGGASTTVQGGGGGGAGGPGGAATATTAGAGGPGLCYNITGTTTCYGGGGGGGNNYAGGPAAAGGNGGGGVGGTTTVAGGTGAANTGAGGGGGGGGGRGSGANGVVIVAY